MTHSGTPACPAEIAPLADALATAVSTVVVQGTRASDRYMVVGTQCYRHIYRQQRQLVLVAMQLERERLIGAYPASE